MNNRADLSDGSVLQKFVERSLTIELSDALFRASRKLCRSVGNPIDGVEPRGYISRGGLSERDCPYRKEVVRGASP